jgi:hypothetical protein
MKKTYFALLTVVLLTVFAILAPSQSGGEFVMRKSIIASGGERSAGGIFIVDGTIGQPFGSAVSADGIYSETGGFWNADPVIVSVAVSLPAVNAAPGSAILVPITIGDVTGLGIIEYHFHVNYDPAVVQAASPVHSHAGTLSSNMIFETSTGSGGLITIDAFQPSPLSGSGTLLNLRFNVVGTAGQSSSLVFPNFTFNEGNPLAATTNGGVTVTGASSITGTVTYGNAIGNPPAPRFVKNVSVASTAGSPAVGPGITGTSGTYSLTGFGAGSYTIKPTKPGGPNAAINSFDAARVAQGVAGTVPFVSQNQRFVSDSSGNGSVTSNDAALIAKFAAGLGGAGNVGQWKFFVTGAPSPLPTAPQTYNDSRTYASVSGNATGEDFVALLIGEASGNYNTSTNPRGTVVGGQMSDVGEEGRAAEKPMTVTIQNVIAAADKEIVIPVSVEGAAGREISSYEFDLRYDPAVVQPSEDPVDVAGTVSRGLSVVANAGKPGILRVVVYGPIPIDSDGVLLNLRFNAVGASGSASPLTWERIMFGEGGAKTAVANGLIELLSE